MLKDLMDKYNPENKTDINIESAITVLDVLNYESGSSYIKNNMEELGKVCDEINILILSKENLTNESGLVSYLIDEGYENVTTESAKEIAKDAWEKIKKVIKFLVDKFLLIFNKIKSFLFSTASKIEKIFTNLKREISARNGNPNVALLENNMFGSKFPVVADFGNKENILKIVETVRDSVYILNKIDTPHSFERHIKRLDGWSSMLRDSSKLYILGILNFKPELKYLYCHTDTDKLEVKSAKIVSSYNVNNKSVLSKPDIITLLDKSLDLNHGYKLFVSDIEKAIKNLNNLKPLENSRFFNSKNAEVNTAVAITSCKTFLENYETIMSDLAYVLAHNIKCYEK